MKYRKAKKLWKKGKLSKKKWKKIKKRHKRYDIDYGGSHKRYDIDYGGSHNCCEKKGASANAFEGMNSRIVEHLDGLLDSGM